MTIPHKITLDVALPRVVDAATALSLGDPDRTTFLAIVGPELPLWLEADDDLRVGRRTIGLDRLADRCQQAFAQLALDSSDLLRVLEVLVPERMRVASLDVPTDALPGSEERIRVLEERYTAGRPLFAAGDVADFPEGCGLTLVQIGPKYVGDVIFQLAPAGPPERWSAAWWLGEEYEPPCVAVPVPDQVERVRVSRAPKKPRKSKGKNRKWPLGRRGQLFLFEPGERRPLVRRVKTVRPAPVRVWLQLTLWPLAGQEIQGAA